MSVEENADRICRRAGKELNRMRDVVMPTVMRSQLPVRAKYIRLIELADKALELVKPNTPCRKGCFNCCYMAVPIDALEAERISTYTGRKPTDHGYPPASLSVQTLEDTYKRLNEGASRFERTPCTFLGPEGECTIYSVRPMNCRVHHVVEDDSEKCDLFTGRDDQGQVDLQWLQYAATTLSLDGPIADIREWFPYDATTK